MSNTVCSTNTHTGGKIHRNGYINWFEYFIGQREKRTGGQLFWYYCTRPLLDC